VHLDRYVFGSIEIDGVPYERDVVIDRGEVRKRKKGASKPLRQRYGHTPLSIEESIPWKCDRLVVGTGAEGSLPVTPEVEEEARRRHVELILLPTRDAMDLLNAEFDAASRTNGLLHLTC
jgi:hypothetical protein